MRARSLATLAIASACAAHILASREGPRLQLAPAEASLPHAIHVGPRVPVSPVGTGPHFWLGTSADPHDARRLIVCGTRSSPRHNSAEGFVYASRDGGRTWEEVLVDAATRWVSEHSCAIGPGGLAYFVGNASEPGSRGARTRPGQLRIYQSHDGGLSWGEPLTGPHTDWTSVTIDASQDASGARAYVFANDVKDRVGQWSASRPLLFTLTGDPTSLSAPVAAPRPTGFQRVAAFQHASAILGDGTIVGLMTDGRSYARAMPDGDERKYFIAIVSSTDSGRTLNEPVVIAEPPSVAYPTLAVDHARHRLYVAWIESRDQERQVMLARSDTSGRSWNVQVAIQSHADDPLMADGPVTVAVNREGVVGLHWPAANRSCARFSASFDEGRSFEPSVPLGPCAPDVEPTNLQYFEAHLRILPFLEEYPMRSHPNELGLSIRLNVMPMSQTAMASDAGGAFHPIWWEIRDGRSQLWTSTVTVSERSAALPGIEGLIDRSADVGFEFSNNRYDAMSQTFFVDLRIINNGDTVIHSPLRVRVESLRSDFGESEVDNADNLVRANGAIWDLSDQLESHGLAPRARTAWRTLAFRMKSVTAMDRGNPVSARLKVYGGNESPK